LSNNSGNLNISTLKPTNHKASRAPLFVLYYEMSLSLHQQNTEIMITQVTHGIRVTVETNFQELYSDPAKLYYLFTYKIKIENTGDYDVQLLRRSWNIFDSISERRAVDGAGVVGQQPVLRPGEVYEYESACNLKSEFGKMSGAYSFERLVDGASFNVQIPEFRMTVPYRLN
jgi:ApaG protein